MSSLTRASLAHPAPPPVHHRGAPGPRAAARVPSPSVSRYAFLLRPKFVLFTVLMAGLVVLMVNLAFWQLRRLHERRDSNAQITEHVHERPIGLSQVLTGSTTDAQVQDQEWRTVSSTGRYVPADQVLIRNRSQDSNDGYHVVTPFRTTSGTTVLVNRGWIPLERQADTTPTPPAPPSGTVTITGRIRAGQHKGRFFSPTDPPTGRLKQLYRVDLARIGQQVGYPLLPAYLELESTSPAPSGPAPTLIALPALDEGPHLSYAVQWFFFSGCAIAGWILAVRRSAKQREKAAELAARDAGAGGASGPGAESGAQPETGTDATTGTGSVTGGAAEATGRVDDIVHPA